MGLLQMTLGLSVLSLALLLVVIYLTPSIIALWRFMRKVWVLPTSDTVPFMGHAFKVFVPSGQLLTNVKEMIINKLMFTLWLGPVPVLLVVGPRLAEVILGSTKSIDKIPMYRFMEPWLGTGLLTSTGEKWQSHRKMLTPTFHFNILETFIDVFAEKSKILVKKLRRELGSESFDIYPYITACGLDVICETAMGIESNAQDEDSEEYQYMKSVTGISDAIMKRIVRPFLYPGFIFNLTHYGKEAKKHNKILHDFTNKVIRERKELRKQGKAYVLTDEDISLGRKKKMAFLDLLLEISEKGNNITDEEIREEVDTFMFEGHDTTTAALCWGILLLGLNQDVQQAAYEELEGIFQGSDRSPTWSDLSDMKYIERTIKEILRMCPSVPVIGRKLKEDIEIDGYHIPSGMLVGVVIAATHRDEKYFPNPECFNPDNFLPEKVAKRHPYAYVPFSAGPRNCIGQRFALLEMKVILSTLIRNYKFEYGGVEPVPVPELIMRSGTGFWTTMTARKPTA